MKVNMQNYEEYFVRFVDNDLSAEEAGEVQLFLQQHPGLKAELDAFRSAVLIPDASIQFSGKDKRKVYEAFFELSRCTGNKEEKVQAGS